jgi:hypothetical protein
MITRSIVGHTRGINGTDDDDDDDELVLLLGNEQCDEDDKEDEEVTNGFGTGKIHVAIN